MICFNNVKQEFSDTDDNNLNDPLTSNKQKNEKYLSNEFVSLIDASFKEIMKWSITLYPGNNSHKIIMFVITPVICHYCTKLLVTTANSFLINDHHYDMSKNTFFINEQEPINHHFYSNSSLIGGSVPNYSE